jgi:hypothetical protein
LSWFVVAGRKGKAPISLFIRWDNLGMFLAVVEVQVPLDAETAPAVHAMKDAD